MMHLATLDGTPPWLATGDIKKKRLSAQPASGRLSMMAINASFFQDGWTGSAWGDWVKYTASPPKSLLAEKVAVETLQMRVLQMKSLMAWSCQKDV
mmetsp:Transcript_60982/g.120775  ORF Transcript_60982/g.120775 Transcript_60982/m.120775 type:complete len:96 (+) Transcript_60982:1155-1442(+)